jgi:hypothetical protein
MSEQLLCWTQIEELSDMRDRHTSNLKPLNRFCRSPFGRPIATGRGPGAGQNNLLQHRAMSSRSPVRLFPESKLFFEALTNPKPWYPPALSTSPFFAAEGWHETAAAEYQVYHHTASVTV